MSREHDSNSSYLAVQSQGRQVGKKKGSLRSSVFLPTHYYCNDVVVREAYFRGGSRELLIMSPAGRRTPPLPCRNSYQGQRAYKMPPRVPAIWRKHVKTAKLLFPLGSSWAPIAMARGP